MREYRCNKCGVVGNDLHFVKTHACAGHSAATGFTEVRPAEPKPEGGRVVNVPAAPTKVRRER